MFDAYTSLEVASKLEKSVDISCLTSHHHSARVYAGSKAGHLLSLTESKQGKRGYDLVMCRSFEKKTVHELQVVARHGILLCLSDSQVSAHDTTEPFTFKAAISDNKPITAFCSHVTKDDGLLYVAVAARRKILLYKWLLDDFTKMPLELTPAYLNENAQCMSWCGPIISFSVQNDYHYMTIFPLTEEVVEVNKLFSIGSKAGEPLIVDIPDKELIAYCRDNFLFFQEYSGDAGSVPKVKFSCSPLQIVYDAPYLLALLTKGRIEIRSVQPTTHIQTIQINRAMYISAGLPGTVYAGSVSDVWLLDSRPQMKSNIERLVYEKHFELATQLAERCEDIGDVGVVEIKRKSAFNFFCQRRFDEWLEIHSQVNTDVMTVIAHFPQLLDVNYRVSLESLLDEPPPRFAENDLRCGLNALARYLAAVRTEHAKAVLDYMKEHGENGSNSEEVSNHRNVLQVVDTTLLKCYIEANESLIASLMRLPDNMCILADSERILMEHRKYYELYLLYERRSLHQKALTLLRERAHIPGTVLSGCGLTVQYLQKLGNANLDIIFSFASWVLHDDMDAGLSVFTCDEVEVRELDRERVLQFLTHECVAAVIPYLEHIIFEWGEKGPKFHDILGDHYIAKVKQLIKEYISSLKDDENIVRAGKEDGELGLCRRKLHRFLQSSTSYSPEKLLVQLRYDSMHEERAILFGRLKRHEQALAIYTNVLRDYKAAENYCKVNYDRQDPENSKVYLILLRMYTHPPDASVLGLMQSDVYRASPNQTEAVRILKEHASAIDTVEAISLLPSDYTLKCVWNALEAVLQATHDRRIAMQLHRAICGSALAHCLDRKTKSESVKFTIGYASECAVCGKKIGNSAFAYHPSGRLEHFYCYQQQEAPVS
uniref:CNH domain-containing protein n=2 Tax=Parascaris univalens TaxID=6257 RepID=A0A914ZRK7_PARUN